MPLSSIIISIVSSVLILADIVILPDNFPHEKFVPVQLSLHKHYL